MRKVSHNGDYLKVTVLEFWNRNDLLSENAFNLGNSFGSCIEA